MAQRTDPLVGPQTRLLTWNTAAQEHGGRMLQPASRASAYPQLVPAHSLSRRQPQRGAAAGGACTAQHPAQARRGRTWRARGRAACRRRRARAECPPARPAARRSAAHARAPAGRAALHMTALVPTGLLKPGSYWPVAPAAHACRMRRHAGPRCRARSGGARCLARLVPRAAIQARGQGVAPAHGDRAEPRLGDQAEQARLLGCVARVRPAQLAQERACAPDSLLGLHGGRDPQQHGKNSCKSVSSQTGAHSQKCQVRACDRIHIRRITLHTPMPTSAFVTLHGRARRSAAAGPPRSGGKQWSTRPCQRTAAHVGLQLGAPCTDAPAP